MTIAKAETVHQRVHAEVENQLGRRFWDGIPTHKINQGQCSEFAHHVVNALGQNVWTTFGPGHVFIAARHEQVMYFDAECPEGVYDPRNLPFYQRSGFGDDAWIRKGWIPVPGGIVPMPDDYRKSRMHRASRIIGTEAFMKCFMSYPIHGADPIEEIQYF